MAKVTIYKDADFSGSYQELGAGRHNGLLIGNDEVSSVKVPPGWKATLWWDTNFSGGSKILIGDTSYVESTWNDETTSIAVSCPATEAPLGTPRSLALLGNGAYIDIGATRTHSSSGEFAGCTIEAWVFFDQIGNWSRIVDLFLVAGQDDLILCREGKTSNLYFGICKAGVAKWLSVPGVIRNGQWMHVAATLDASGVAQVFVDGKTKPEWSAQLHIPEDKTRSTGYVGKSWYSGDSNFVGQLCELRIWNVQRSAAEIARMMNGRLTGTEQGLVRYLRCDETSGTVLVDSAGVQDAVLQNASASAVLFGLAGPTLRDPITLPTAMQLDGDKDYLTLPPVDLDFSQPWTLETWVYHSEVRAWTTLFDLGNGPGTGTAADDILIGRESGTNALFLRVYKGSASVNVPATYIKAPALLELGRWQHLAITMSGVAADGTALFSFYRNGVLVCSDRGPIPNNVVRSRCYVGKCNWDPTIFLKGRLAEVRLWNVARSAEEILAGLYVPQDPETPSLYRYYPLNETSGTLAKDATPRGLHASPAAIVAWNQAPPASLATVFPPPQALMFNGADTFVQLPPLSDDLSRGLTIEAWVYFEETTSGARIVDLGSGPGIDNIILSREGSTSDLSVQIYGNTWGALQATGVIQNGVWLHVAVSIGGSSTGIGPACLYVNGVPRASGNLPLPKSGVTRSKSYLGKSNWTENALLWGRLADVRLWSVARTASEIRSTMNRALQGTETGLLRCYPLDEGSGSFCFDKTSPGADSRQAKIVGSATRLRSVQPLSTHGGLGLDGQGDYVELPPFELVSAEGVTICAWVYFDGIKVDECIIELGNGPNTDSIVLSRASGLQALALEISQDGLSSRLETPTGVLNAGSWQHIAAVIDPQGNATIYVGGVALASKQLQAPKAGVTRSQCYVGHSSRGTQFDLKGRVCDVQLWNAVRSATELAQQLSTSIDVRDSRLSRAYPLHEKTGTALASVAQTSGKLQLGATWTSLPHKYPLEFDGTGCYVQIPSLSQDFSKGFTIEAWVRFTGTGSWTRIVDLGAGQAANNIVIARYSTTSDLVLAIYRDSSYDELRATDAIPLGRWFHVAVTLDSVSADGSKGDAHIYVNGVEVATGSIHAPRSGVVRSKCWIGKSNWSGDPLFRGQMSEVRIFSAPRTASQIAATYATPLAGNESGLCRLYRLDTPLATQAIDSSPAAAHGSIFSTLTTQVTGSRNGLSFNGTSDYVALLPLATDLSRGFTISAWVLFKQYGRFARIVDLGNGSASDNIILCRYSSTELELAIYNGGSQTELITTTGVLPSDGNWFHVAATLSADGTAAIYVNGTKVTSKTSMMMPRSGVVRSRAYVGKSNWNADPLLSGQIADLALFDRALSATEIVNVKYNGLTGSEIGLVHLYRLYDRKGCVVPDRVLWSPQAGLLFGSQMNLESWRPDAKTLAFNGAGGAAQLPSQAVDLRPGFTIEAWIFCSGGPKADETLICFGSTLANRSVILCRDKTSDDLVILFATESGLWSARCPSILRSDIWFHLGVSVSAVSAKDGTRQATFYLSGQRIAGVVLQKESAKTIQSDGLSWLGCGPSGTTPFAGRIAEVRLWNRVLTASEIDARAEVRLAGNETGLIRYYPLSATVGLTVPDGRQGTGATVRGNPIRIARPLRTPESGPMTGALALDGQRQVVTLSQLSVDFSLGFTFESWVYLNGTQHNVRIFSIGRGAGADTISLSRVAVLSDGIPNDLLLSVSQGDQVKTLAAQNVVPERVYFHIAITVDATGQGIIYVDGSERARGTVYALRSGVLRPKGFLGCGDGDELRIFGSLSEVRIWNRARTASEIAETKNRTLYDSDPSLVAYYRGTETDGVVLHDSSHSVRDAAITGLRQIWGVAAPLFLPPPHQQGALVLNGSDDWVELPRVGADLSLGFCLEAWILPEDDRAWACIFDLGNGAPLDNVILGRRGTDRALVLEVYRGTTKYSVETSAESIKLGVWTHIAATVDSTGKATLYVQGGLAQSIAAAVPAALSRKAAIGRSRFGTQTSFCGQITEARIWNVPRSQSDIQKSMTSRLRGTEAGLVVNHRLNETDGERAGDATKAASHAWVRGRCAWSTGGGGAAIPLPVFAPWKPPQGTLRFDGSVHVALPTIWSSVTTPTTTGLCLEAYVYCDEVTQTVSLIDLGSGSGGADNVYLGKEGSTLVFAIQVATNAVQFVRAAGVLTASTWTHVAASVDENGHVLLCKDGVPLSIDRNVIDPPRNGQRTSSYLGRSQAGVRFAGRMTEARIWSRSRTPQELLSARSCRLGGAVSGMLRCYPLLGSSGRIVRDSSDEHQDGIVSGLSYAWDLSTPSFQSVVPIQTSTASSGALSFDGASTYVRLPSVTEDLAKGFTLEAWVYFESVGSWSRILDIGQGMRLNNVFLARYGTTNQVAMRVYYDGANYTEFVTTSQVLSLNTWIHISATLDAAGNVCIYKNGVSVTLNQSKLLKFPSPVVRDRAFIGKSNWYWDAMFKGRMAEVRLWNRARSNDEIAALRSVRLTGSERGLFGYYRLDEAQGSLIADRSSRGETVTGYGDLGWGSPALPLGSAAVAVVPTQALDVPTPTEVLTPVATNTGGSSSISTSDSLVDLSIQTYVSSGISFDLFGVPAQLLVGGLFQVTPIAKTFAFSGTLTLTKPVSLPSASGTLVLAQDANPMVYRARFSTSFSVAQLVHAVAVQAGIATVVDALVVPPLQAFSNPTIIVASGEGYDPAVGDFCKGMNFYATQKVSDLPGISLLPNKWKIDLLHLDQRFLVLAVGIRSATEYRFSGRAILDIPLIPGNAVSLTFNELGLNSAVGPGKTSFAIAHRFTLRLFGESLVFQGEIGVEKGSTAEDIVVWGALDPDENQYPDGKWHNPFGCPGVVIDGLGVQLKLADKPPFLGVGLRGGVHLGDGLLGASIALNFDPANVDQTILAIESPEGIDLPRLIKALLDLTKIPGLDALLSILDVSITDLVIYFAPNGGSIAGKDYDRGISIGGALNLWGYHARLFGCLSVTSGGVLQGQADRISIVVAGVTLIKFTDVSGQNGPSVDISLTTARQGVYYSGKLILLNGLYDNYQELSISREGLSFLCPTDMGSLELRCKQSEYFIALSPRFKYGFSVLGLSVSVDIGGRIANRVDASGYHQDLSFWFHVCGVDVSVGPVSWGVTLTDLKSLGEVFEHFFADTVKSFFTNQLGKAMKAAFEWVRNNLTDLAEEAVELFKSAGAAAIDIAKHTYEIFNVGAQELIGYLGTGLTEAAAILRDALGFLASEAAEILGSAFGAAAGSIKSALAAAGYVASEIDSIADDVWNAINDSAGYLDPTSW